MMSSLIQSPQFTFFIGEEEKPVVVHSAAIAATSEYFNALINGGMDEAQKRCATFKDVRVDDFVRFCEFAYRGDYTVPAWEPDPLGPLDPPAEPDDPQEVLSKKGREKRKKMRAPPQTWSVLLSASRQASYRDTSIGNEFAPHDPTYYEVAQVVDCTGMPMRTSSTQLQNQFNNRNYPLHDCSRDGIFMGFQPVTNNTAEQCFTPVFLAYARLYNFAHLRLVTSLKTLTLSKLHQTLLCFKLYRDRIGDVIVLARYAYSDLDLPNRGDDGTLDELRMLVVEYIVCALDIIGEHDEFIKLMEEGGEFVGDFWRLARKYR
jgi:hypothetical protein